MSEDTESLQTRSPRSAQRQAELGAARAARLVVVVPASSRDVIALDENPLMLGRERLNHSSVSRKHLEIVWRAGAHRIGDTGSKNGSWLGGERLEAAQALRDGDVVRAGGVVMVYEIQSARSPSVERASDDALMAAVPGRSSAARTLRDAIVRAAPDPAPALVLGETGVGKERVARELHRLSGRAGPFVAINVAELSEQLVESQLFGHVKGAFTGAEQAQPGLFRAAHRGTLLLDEIGELPIELQAKLLRVIQEREVRPVGSTRAEPIDVRVVGATHADLPTAVEAGRFRRDLWARLSLIELQVPALAARRADIIDWFVILYARWAAERGLEGRDLDVRPEAAEALLMRALPENLRTLERVVHRLDPEEPVLGDDLVEKLLGPRAPHASPRAADAGAPVVAVAPPPTTREELAEALTKIGSVHGLARHYGKARRQIYRWLTHFGLR